MRNISKYEDEYLKPDFEAFLVKQRRRKVLEAVFGKRNILEIGCGMEPLFMYMSWPGIEKVTVFEPGKNFAENALKHVKNTGMDVQVIGHPFASGDCDRQCYDAIVCSGLLHELENPEEMLRDIYTVSKVDTVIHINVPNANSFHRILAREMGILSDEKELSERNIRFQQHRVFDMKELCRMLNSCGFEVIESGSYFIKPFTHDQMKKMLDTAILNEEVLDGLYNMTKYMPEFGCEIYANCRKR